MDDELIGQYRRWLAAEQDGRDDDADAACRELFEEASAQPLPALDFTARTMAAVAEQTAADQERGRRTRRVAALTGALVLVAGAYFGGSLAVSLATSLLVGTFDLLISAVVRTATGAQAGADLWTVLAGIGRAASAFVSDPKVTFALLLLQALAIGALVALQRLLGTDGESLK